MRPLAERFLSFGGQLKDAERIDDLPLTPEQRAARKADLFLQRREIIAEVKALTTDTSPKIDRLLAPYRNTEAWPQFYGTWPLSHIIANLPNPDELRAKVLGAITSAIPQLIRDANRQIRTTKRTFALPRAAGLLVLLNQHVDLLAPETIAAEVYRHLAKRTPDGQPRFPHVEVTWLLCESHQYALVPGILHAHPMALLQHPLLPGNTGVDEYVVSLGEPWAAFNQAILATYDGPLPPSATTPRSSTPPQPDTNNEDWRRSYHANPYLRALSNDDLFRFGRQVMDQLWTIEGAKHKMRADRSELLAQFAHFIEEINHRGLPRQRWGPAVAGNAVPNEPRSS